MIESLNSQVSSKASAIPRHQAIGRNGSFWMPKDIPVAPKVSGSNAHVQTKHSKGPSNSANLPNHQSVDSQPKTVNQGNRSFAGLIRSAEKSTEVKLKNNSQEAPKTNVAKSRQQFTQPRLAKILVPATNIKVRAVVAKPIAFSSSTKELQKQEVLESQSRKDPLDRDSGSQGKGRGKKQHGARNAHLLVPVEIKDTDKANTAATLPVSVPNGENNSSKISNFVGKSVLPRVAYVNKFQKKIVRFAIDLPGGGKLGVRLEKKQDTLSLSLIAPQDEIRNLMNNCKNGIKSKVNSNQSNQLEVQVFSNFSEMDDFFLKAA